MLRAYSKNIAVNANSAIPFNVDKISVGNSVEHPTASSIVVKKPGYYMVTFDASLSAAVDGLVTIQLFANGTAIPDAVIVETLTTGNTANVSFTTIIRALPGVVDDDVTLTVVPNEALTLTSTAIGVNKVA